MKNKHRKAGKARGYLDSLIIRGEHMASYLTRRNSPAQVTLDRIMNLVEKAQNYKHTIVKNGKQYSHTSPSRVEGQEKQREKCIARLWECYNQVLESEVMHKSKKGKDETWNNAKRVGTSWVSEPLYFYGDQFDYEVGDETYGMKAQGRTPVSSSNYDGEESEND
jgi:hypothetical protein